MKTNMVLILKPNYGSIESELNIAKEVENFNLSNIEFSSSYIKIYNPDNVLLDSDLIKTDEDWMSITYVGEFSNGKKFRIKVPGGIILQNMGSNPEKRLTIASLFPSGYAIHFKILENK